MDKSINQMLADIVQKNQHQKEVAVKELLKILKDHQYSSHTDRIRSVVLYLMQMLHDWENIVKYTQLWNAKQFSKGFIVRMYQRVNEVRPTIPPENIWDQMQQLNNKYWKINGKTKSTSYEEDNKPSTISLKLFKKVESIPTQPYKQSNPASKPKSDILTHQNTQKGILKLPSFTQAKQIDKQQIPLLKSQSKKQFNVTPIKQHQMFDKFKNKGPTVSITKSSNNKKDNIQFNQTSQKKPQDIISKIDKGRDFTFDDDFDSDQKQKTKQQLISKKRQQNLNIININKQYDQFENYSKTVKMQPQGQHSHNVNLFTQTEQSLIDYSVKSKGFYQKLMIVQQNDQLTLI